MRDEIFWGNLIGLLKTGKWNMNLQEIEAFIQVYQEAVSRSRPQSLATKEVKEKVKKDGNK